MESSDNHNKRKNFFYKAIKKWSFWLIAFCIGLCIWSALGVHETQFSKTAAKLTNLIVGNGWNIRSYDERGIPYSHVARLKEKVISPYYVIHTGLIYSQSIDAPSGYDWLWAEDQSFECWDENPPVELITKNNFIHSADWIMERLEEDEFGNIHIPYHFSWSYKGTSEGVLSSPWHSGLTDAVAIKLLLRAYLVTNEECYLDASSRLYDSVLKPIGQGGSLIIDQYGNPWIEEYVARNNTNYPRVLNGMIYATLAIRNYERFMAVESPIGDRLAKSIKIHLLEYDADYWTRAKPKYHHIHVELVSMLFKETGDPYFADMASKWGNYNTHFFVRYFLKGRPTVNSLIVLSLSIFLWVLTTFITYIVFYGFSILLKRPVKPADKEGIS